MNNIKDIFSKIKNKMKIFKKDRSNSRRFKIFYSRTAEDKRNDLAKAIDYILWRMFIFFGIFISTFLKLLNFSSSLFIAIVVLCIYHLISIKFRTKKLQEQKNEKRKRIASQRVYKEILNKTMDEMKEYIYCIFNRVGFTHIENVNTDNKSMIFRGEYSGNEIILSCVVNKADFDVELKDLKEFLCKLAQYNIKKGIFITTSDFTQDCYSYLNQVSDNYTILLINKDKFLGIIEGVGMYPSEEEIDEAIENKISKKKKNWGTYKLIVFSNKKIKGYFALSLFLMIASLYLPYTVYYMIMGMVSMFLTLMTLTIHLYNKKHQQQDSWEEIEGLFKTL